MQWDGTREEFCHTAARCGLTVCALQTEGSDVKQGDSQQNRIHVWPETV